LIPDPGHGTVLRTDKETSMGYDVKVEDIEYLRHGNTPYLATIYRPQGTGPFPIMVELHGGAWCRSDRHGDKVIHEALAKTGVIVATLDWRQPPTASYPASFQDIHYGIRWIKSRAVELGGRPDMVGSMGNSSGGHQAMLLAMRPFDPRYSALPLATAPALDATVRCVIMTSPVIDPLGPVSLREGRHGQGQAVPGGRRRAPAVPRRVLEDRRSDGGRRAGRSARARREGAAAARPVPAGHRRSGASAAAS
jgi:acetyl esterase/lipase